ncbi:MAG: sodium:proton antiporter [Myxococcales bacterium]|nr:MAG: sodium:proton antiporter [Myxococcales bacterium]
MRKAVTGSAIGAAIFLVILLLLYFFAPHTEGLEEEIGKHLAVVTVAPFIAILLGIALIPLAFTHWWESNLNKGIIAAVCGLPMLIYFLGFVDDGGAALLSLSHEYYSFIILLFALFTIAGGIHLEGDLRATPATNTTFLAIGGLLASFVGTTGAAMLLIRPLLRTNSERRNVVHIFVFFIFIVANIGGSLLPIGDPPLFLGFLRGVPFFWTLQLWKEWLATVSLLLVLFYFWDLRAYKKEALLDQLRDKTLVEPLTIRGKINFLFLGGVIASIVLLTDHLAWWREPVMVALAIVSYLLDKHYEARRKSPDDKSPREQNFFTFNAIVEVAVLFAGIFVTMLPAICLLKAHGAEFGVDQPWQFFWLTGGLSSFLDNAPTYLTFMSLGQGLNICGGDVVCVAGVPVKILQAISVGAVFMGANTYIGNAPNFMVKAIVDEAGVKMPSFLGYMKYSVGILIPTFLLVTLIFFL